MKCNKYDCTHSKTDVVFKYFSTGYTVDFNGRAGLSPLLPRTSSTNTNTHTHIHYALTIIIYLIFVTAWNSIFYVSYNWNNLLPEVIELTVIMTLIINSDYWLSS